MIINLSNHPSSSWDANQLHTAISTYGDISDYPFPMVPADANEDYIKALADTISCDIISKHPYAVMVQGEMTLCFAIITRLRVAGIKAVAACSKRMVTEQNGRKLVEFKFEKFREYI